jgi:hypothetical protein
MKVMGGSKAKQMKKECGMMDDCKKEKWAKGQDVEETLKRR